MIRGDDWKGRFIISSISSRQKGPCILPAITSSFKYVRISLA
jgi:hypothetical protein